MMSVITTTLLLSAMWLSTALAVATVAVTMSPPTADAGEGTPPRIRSGHFETNLQVPVGQHKLQLVCPVESDTDLMVGWRKDGESIGAGWLRYSISSNGHKLRIKNVVKSDTGRYTCDAVNGFGRQVVTFTVIAFDENGPGEIDYDVPLPNTMPAHIVNDAPRFVDPALIRQLSAQPIERAIGSSVRLPCPVSGTPTPSITWMFNKSRVTAERLRQMGWQLSDGGQTLFKETLRLKDSVSITCQAVNVAGHVDATFDVHITQSGIPPSSFDRADPHPMNTTVTIGAPAQLICNVHSPIAPMIKWLRKVTNGRTMRGDDRLIDVMVNGEALTVAVVDGDVTKYTSDDAVHVHTNTLTLPAANSEDDGEYICFVTDSTGTLLHRQATLTVIGGAAGKSKTTELLIACLSAAGAMITVLVCIILLCRCCTRRAKPVKTTLTTNANLYHQQPPPPSRPAPQMPQVMQQQQQPLLQHNSTGATSPRTPYSSSTQHNTYKTSLMSASSTAAYQQFEAQPPPLTYADAERQQQQLQQQQQHIYDQGYPAESFHDARYPNGRIQPYPSMYSCR